MMTASGVLAEKTNPKDLAPFTKAPSSGKDRNISQLLLKCH